ncbi:MAG: DNA phosphorothioation system sulfurtransferase DndC [Desulfovibrionaceae bacterium]|nr:DNA phosphorothioation system sulfurtransferase DndC [Desulfovibrionaceae bacterium]
MEKSVFDEIGFSQFREQLHREIQELYLENERPWVIGYSGGKDSTAVVQLIWQALALLPPDKRNHKKVHVITTDTLVENPVVVTWVEHSLTLMRERADADNMPFESHILRPKTKNSFWVNLIGRGYPAPRAKFRWCTERLKIWPSNEFILDVVSTHGEAILALGTRKAESNIRARVMEYYEKWRARNRLSPHSQISNCLIYTPIEDWTNDDVWLFLMRTQNPWGLENTELLELYKDATEDRECPLIVNLEDSTPSCGSSRFGCWVCTLVARDRSMEAMVANDAGKSWLQPLLDFRSQLTVKNDTKMRDFRRAKGQVQLFHNAPIHGPYLQAQREIFLGQLLRAERRLMAEAPNDYRHLRLISLDELREIRRIWLTEKHEIEDRLPKIYEEATGEKYPEPEHGYYHCFGEDNLDILADVCGEDRLSYEMIRELIDIEWDYRTKLRRAGIYESMENAIKRSYYENEEDALTYTLHLESMKKGVQGTS